MVFKNSAVISPLMRFSSVNFSFTFLAWKLIIFLVVHVFSCTLDTLPFHFLVTLPCLPSNTLLFQLSPFGRQNMFIAKCLVRVSLFNQRHRQQLEKNPDFLMDSFPFYTNFLVHFLPLLWSFLYKNSHSCFSLLRFFNIDFPLLSAYGTLHRPNALLTFSLCAPHMRKNKNIFFSILSCLLFYCVLSTYP